jgi:lipoate-protein ligase A
LEFRFLLDGPHEGAFNMAVDEAIFLSAAENSGRATVRLYGFDPPTVSIGFRQELAQAVDVARCLDLGVDCVRRPTGGRVLLHQHELTYSVAAPASGVFRGLGVRAVYNAVSGAIRHALTGLGIPLDPPAARSGQREPGLDLPCLALASAHEVTSGGRKVVASSQRRGRRIFLQHGSILRKVDRALWEKLHPPGTAVPLNAVGIDDLSREPIPPDLLVASLKRSFEVLFDAEAAPGGLSGQELERIPELRLKYRSLRG